MSSHSSVTMCIHFAKLEVWIGGDGKCILLCTVSTLINVNLFCILCHAGLFGLGAL